MAKAIDVAERPVKLGKDKQRIEIAHFYCELALQQLGSDDMDRAMTLLKRGCRRQKQCAGFHHDGTRVHDERGLCEGGRKPAARNFP